MPLNSGQIESISRQIHSQFPEMRDAHPTVRNQPGAKSASPSGSEQYLLTFQSKGQGPGGRTINHIVRVVADGRGKVLKVSTSR